MVDIILKLTGPEVNVTSANTLGGAVLFRVYNPGASDALITITDAQGSVIGSMTQPQGFVEILEKRATDRVSANTSIRCTPVAYK